MESELVEESSDFLVYRQGVPLGPIEHKCWCGLVRVDDSGDDWGYLFWQQHRLDHKKEAKKQTAT